MKSTIVVCLSLLLSACATGFDPDFRAGMEAGIKVLSDKEKPPKAEVSYIVEKIVDEMLSNNQFVSKQHAIAVASIVDLGDLETTSRLGQQISEGVIHHLHNNGYRVVDFKMTGAIQVTPEGDFTHSRDWEKLKGQFKVDYLVSGTMNVFDDGLSVNVRMVGLQTQVVVASAQAFIAQEVVSGFMPEAEMLPEADMPVDNSELASDKVVDRVVNENQPHHNQVQLDNGMLTRKLRRSVKG